MDPATILVTGGAGFVGSSVAIHLRRCREGRRVVAMDNLRRRGSELTLGRLRAAGVEFMHGDVRSPADLDVGLRAELVVECAADPSVLAGVGGSPEYVLQTNLIGTLNVLEYCRRNRSAVVFLSTSRVYPIAALRSICLEEAPSRFEIGLQQSLPGISRRGISEEFPLAGARSIYGASKLASELFIEEYQHAYGLSAVVNRCGVIAGPWQMGKVDQGFVALWLARHVYGGRLSYIGFGGTGKQVRDVLHIADLCDLLTRQISALDGPGGMTFNVGGGPDISVSLRELTDLCRALTGVAIPVDAAGDERPGDVPLYVSDNTKVQQATGWSPTRSLETVLGDTLDWIRRHTAELKPVLAS